VTFTTFNQNSLKTTTSVSWGEKEREHNRFQSWIEELNDPKKKDHQKTTSIAMKLQSGKKLSNSELDHLRRNCPELYNAARRSMAERAAYERKLRNCRSKEEVRRLHSTSTMSAAAGGVTSVRNGDSGGGETASIRISALNAEHRDFIHTKQYKDMPETQKQIEKEKRARRFIRLA